MNTTVYKEELKDQDSCLIVRNNFISTQNTEALKDYILSLPLVKYPKGKLFGKDITFHRWMGFFSNTSEGYKFSGQTIKTGGLCPTLQALLDAVNNELKDILDTPFNGILINVYTSGEDYISAHSDDEKELGNKKIVAAISLGQERTFRIRDKKTKEIKLNLPTEDGQLLVMSGNFQQKYTHEIPIEKKKNGIRVSCTFRYHK